MANNGGFSWKVLFGIAQTKRKISRQVGIPLFSKSGRERKVGGAILKSMFGKKH